uniref:Uncharacterized protein n=1 Tax=Arundo donax TaxID=35708 RepID=A0A0A8Z402_ARUDO
MQRLLLEYRKNLLFFSYTAAVKPAHQIFNLNWMVYLYLGTIWKKLFFFY